MKRPTVGLIALLFVFVGNAGQASASPISVGTRINLSQTTFVLPIEVSGGASVISWLFDLTYDPSDVIVNLACDPFSGDIYCSLLTGAVTEGDFFADGAPFNLLNPGFVTLDPNDTSLQAGLLLGVNGAFGGSTPLPSGSGVLAFVEFTVLRSGTSPITVDGAVVSAVPDEASSLLLLALGIMPCVRGVFKRTARRSHNLTR